MRSVEFGIAIVVVILVVAIWAYTASRKMRRHRDQTQAELQEARRELSEVQRELDQARREWQDTIRALTPRLNEQSEKLSEVIVGLNRWQEDRKKLGLTGGWEWRAEAVMKGSRGDRERLREQMAGFRRMLERTISRLKGLPEAQRNRGSTASGEETTT